MAFADNPVESAAIYESSNVIPRYNATTSQLSKEQYIALVSAIDEDFVTVDGAVLGKVNNLTFDDAGKASIVIGLADRTNIDAETLVIKPTADSVLVKDGQVFLNVSADELYSRVKAHAMKTDSDKVTVIIIE